MLIAFEVENYRSIRTSVELQLTAVNYYKEAVSQLIDKKLPGLQGVRYLRSAAIYGPNASGKTALWRAFSTMRDMVLRSASMSADTALPYSPFGLEEGWLEKPTVFTIVFTAGPDDIRYEYSFSYNASEIAAEELSAFPKGHRQSWFKRTTANGVTQVRGSTYLKVPSAVKPLLNDNVLLLSLLANYPKVEASRIIAPIVGWFADEVDLVSRAPDTPSEIPYSGDILDGSTGTEYQRVFIQNMMRTADVGIKHAEVEQRPLPDEYRQLLERLGTSQEELDDGLKTVFFEHQTGGRKLRVYLNDESDGTKQLFGLSGHIAKALERGSVLFVDEVDASMHPVLVTEIVKLFLEPSSNPRGAQLLFTAHNPCLLENGLLRRDQIWFTEKDADGATRLYPLSSYSPRKDESVLAGYLVGRYSAIPVIPDCFGNCDACGSSDS